MMKFLLAQVGQRFEYQGEVYVKSSPIVACHSKSGKQKLIPRSAVIRLCDEGTSPIESNPMPASLDTAKVNTAFAEFYACVEQLLNKSATTPQAALQDQLEQARIIFIQQLK